MILQKLTVVTHVDHTKSIKGELLAFEPYVREMNLWCELFEKVVIYAPASHLTNNVPLATFKHKNVKLRKLFYNNSSNRIPSFRIRLFNKVAPFLRIFQFPLMFARLFWVISRSEFVLVRSPGLPALAANLALKILNKNSIVKWAGSYRSFPHESFYNKIERKIIEIPRSNNRVLIYDNIEKINFIVFFPALLSDDEISLALARSKKKKWTENYFIVSVGRLHPIKGFDLVIHALNLLKNKYNISNWHYYLIGSGILEKKISNLIDFYKLNSHVSMTGTMRFDKVLEYYAEANIAIMPGAVEGWGKVIAEAWAHKALVLAPNRGNPKEILGNGGGILFEPTPEDLADKLKKILIGDIDIKPYIDQGKKEISSMSLGKYKDRIEIICNDIIKQRETNG